MWSEQANDPITGRRQTRNWQKAKLKTKIHETQNTKWKKVGIIGQRWKHIREGADNHKDGKRWRRERVKRCMCNKCLHFIPAKIWLNIMGLHFSLWADSPAGLMPPSSPASSLCGLLLCLTSSVFCCHQNDCSHKMWLHAKKHEWVIVCFHCRPMWLFFLVRTGCSRKKTKRPIEVKGRMCGSCCTGLY